MTVSWLDKIRTVADRNRPSRKPQLWEDFPLAVRRRVELEVAQRARPGWLDQTHEIRLSGAGARDGGPPLRMAVVPREMMNKALFLYGMFEISETRLVQALLRPGMTFVDVGANIGYYALIAARAVGAQGSVHAFESNAAVHERLAENVRLNGFGNVHLHRQAVTRLDDFAAGLAATRGRPIDVLKIDVEGAALEMFAGARCLLEAERAPALLFEAHDLGPVSPVLRAHGYQVRRLHYSLGEGLELVDSEIRFRGLFDAYEAPNYFASKDPDLFGAMLREANLGRSAMLRLLGRI